MTSEDPADGAAPKPGTRGGQTRELILDTALRMFRERGYEATTMRSIATEAGVSVGNAYYYFDSKEHLIQGFYDDMGRQHRALARERMASLTRLDERLRIALLTHIEVIEPYHGFAGSFFKTAADPGSPLSPFSDRSGPARKEATDFFAEVIGESTAKIPYTLADELPGLLWLYQMGVVLYWVHDRSPDAEKTRELIERTVPLVVRVIGLSRVPIVRGVVDDIVDMVRSLSDR